jgi:hypothetical protein
LGTLIWFGRRQARQHALGRRVEGFRQGLGPSLVDLGRELASNQDDGVLALLKPALGPRAQQLPPCDFDEVGRKSIARDLWSLLIETPAERSALAQVSTRSSASHPLSRACQSTRWMRPNSLPTLFVPASRSSRNRAATGFSQRKPSPPLTATGALRFTVLRSSHRVMRRAIEAAALGSFPEGAADVSMSLCRSEGGKASCVRYVTARRRFTESSFASSNYALGLAAKQTRTRRTMSITCPGAGVRRLRQRQQ